MKFVVALLVCARIAHADCDPEPRTDFSLFTGVQRVVNRPAGANLQPFFFSIGMRWELGGEWKCDSTVRVSFSSSLRQDSSRDVFADYVSNEPEFLHNDVKLQLGASFEVLTSHDWWIHASVEKAIGSGLEAAIGARLRDRVQWVGADIVMTTPGCGDCLATPSVGVMVSGGLEGHSATATYVSIGVMAVAGLLGAVGNFLSHCDC